MSEPIEPSAPAPEDLSFGRTVLHALKGEHHDYTTAPLNKAVILLAVPMVLELFMESLFVISDVFWVSHLGKNAIASVGLTESVMTLIYAVAIGLSISAGAIVSRRIGEKNRAGAEESAGQVILVGAVTALVLGAIGAYLSPHILAWMGADAETIRAGASFTRIMLGGNITVFLIFLINAIFRGAGDPIYSMRTLFLANGLNIILGPCFIFGVGPFPRLGIAGAAVATNIGRGVGVIYQLWHLSGNHSRINVHLKNLRPDFPVMRSILRPAWNGIAQFLINTTSWLGLFKILAIFGSEALAGYTIAIRLLISALLPSWGIANAGATLVGQNLGAGRPDRAEAAVRIAARANIKFLGSVGLVFFCFAPFIIGIFTQDEAVHHFGVLSLRIIAVAFPLYAAGMCMEGAFNGAGDTWTPTRLNFCCFWVVQVPLAWILSTPFHLGALGVFIAIPTSYSIFALAAYLFFRAGRWKLKKV